MIDYCPTCLTTFRANPDKCTNLACGRSRPKAGWGRLLGEGELLDRHYRIERVLAVGGAGITYLAQEVDGSDTPNGPRLAIKVLYHARATGSFLTRLSTEAQILQELDHPNIIQLRAFVHRSGSEPYLVTLFEEGGTLTEHVERNGALPAAAASAILLQILGALDVAHQRGVVHRDLKPDNVLLQAKVARDETPHVRVADFGIAKVSGGLTSHVTKMGTFLGTPEYAAPEQFDGMPPTPATDVFAAGALFLHLLTGKEPVSFGDRSDVEGCRADWMAALPPRLTAADMVDADPVTAEVVQAVLRKMLAVRPEDRWTVNQVLKRLRGVATGEVELQPVRDTLELTASPAPGRLLDDPYGEEPPPPGGCGAALAGAGVLGVGVLIGGGALGLLAMGFAAWQWGYFDGSNAVVLGPEPVPIVPEPVVPEAPPPAPEPTPPGPEPGPPPVEPVQPQPAEPQRPPDRLSALDIESPERLDLQSRIDGIGALTSCGYEGTLLATVWVENGRAVRLETWPPTAPSRCLLDAMAETDLGVHGQARVALHL